MLKRISLTGALFTSVLLLTSCGGYGSNPPAAQSNVLLQEGSSKPSLQSLLASGYVEPLCGHPNSGYATCLTYGITVKGSQALGFVRRSIKPLFSSLRTKQSTITVQGYTPADLQSAYNIPSSGGGARTVALVESWDAEYLQSDLNTYRSAFGLSPCTTANGCFTKIRQNGSTSFCAVAQTANCLPDLHQWSQESTLDVDMVSAMCPSCNILVVEANSNAFSDMAIAENEAASFNPFAISNSYGGLGNASAYASAYNHPGIMIFASAGDGGYTAGAATPASYNTVVSVGGTTLVQNNSARGWTDTAWSASEAACSSYTKPAWQTDSGCLGRTVADISFDADGNTGVAIYVSDTYNASSGVPWGPGWVISSGTSIGSPAIAAIYTLAHCVSQTPSFLYTYIADFIDVTSGTSSGCGAACTPNGYYQIDTSSTLSGSGSAACSPAYLCSAVAGYDAPTGVGVPNGLTGFQAPCVVTPVPTPTACTMPSTAPGTPNPHPTQVTSGSTCTS
jgi:subtilase family serine protease